MTFIGTDRYSLSFLHPRFNPFPSTRYQMEVVDSCLQATSKWLTAQRCQRVASALFLAFGSAMAYTAIAASFILPVTIAGIAAGAGAIALSLMGKQMESQELKTWALSTPLDTLVQSYGWRNLKSVLNHEELSDKFEQETSTWTLEEIVTTFGYAPIDEGLAQSTEWHLRLKKEDPRISFRDLIERYHWKVFDYELASIRQWRPRAELELNQLSLEEWMSQFGSDLFSSPLLEKSFIREKIRCTLEYCSAPKMTETLWPGLIGCQSYFSKDDYEGIKRICLDYLKAKTKFTLNQESSPEAAANFARELAKLSQRWRPIQARIREWE